MAESGEVAAGNASFDAPPLPFTSKEYALQLDEQHPLEHPHGSLRDEFLIPSKADLKSQTLPKRGAHQLDDPDLPDRESHDPCIYLCGNSLGLQPRRVATRLSQYLTTWATQGVFGHFKPLSDSPLPTWLDADERASSAMAPIVGADPSEIAVMATLTANLHFLMSSFYTPDPNGRHKIILESKAFPSDHYAVESQIRHHNLDPAKSMITIEPVQDSPTYPLLDTEYIISIIDQHASDTAILLLPGIQFYSGQLFDIKTITAHAQSRGIFVIWDLAHAVGNVPLQLHDWNVDAAAWCSYKYMNAGPGAIGGLFVHSRNTRASAPAAQHRLSGWWGSDKATRFAMTNEFKATPGAAAFQLSNPSIIDLTSLCASLEVFALTDMATLRERSLRLTGYLERLLLALQAEVGHFSIITSRDPAQRGAQLSLKLDDGLLDVVMEELEERSVVVDERKPDVIRVAPAPLYNNFADVWVFVQAFTEALRVALMVKEKNAVLPGSDKLLQTI